MMWWALAGCGADHPTWGEDVAPIAQEACVGCHHDGGIAPFSLEAYGSAAPMADLIAATVAIGEMPPWPLVNDGTCGTFTDARGLSADEIDLFAAWADAEAPEGRGIEPLVVPASGTLQADRSVDIGVDYAPVGDPDDYRCFVVDPGMTEETFLTGYEVLPGNPGIVHHVILYTLDSDAATQAAAALDGADEAPGYECFGSSLVGESRPIAAWAPGTPATTFPSGSGLRLGAGRKLVVQVHYYTGERDGTDRTSIAMTTADTVANEGFVFLLGDLGMRLDPGLEAATEDFELPLSNLGLPLGVYVRGVYPHMHRRGRSMRLEVEHEGAAECMASVDDWNFDWQRMYFYDDPVYVYPQDTLKLTCSFDTSDDTDVVTWGEGTDDEMCLVGLYVTVAP